MNKRFGIVRPYIRWPWWVNLFILGKRPKLRWPTFSSFYRWGK